MNKKLVTKQNTAGKTISNSPKHSYRTVKDGGEMVISRRRIPCACKKCLQLDFGECLFKHITGGAYAEVKLKKT